MASKPRAKKKPRKAKQTAATAAAPAAPEHSIVVGKSGKYEALDLKFGNRHGLVTGATGTGKTVTLQVLAEGFSNAGVPVFAADVKGDLSGIAVAGEAKEAFVKRCTDMGLTYQPDEFPVVFWDVFGQQGHPVRATASEMGPVLLSRIMDLNDAQEGVLNIAFRVADEQGLALLDLKDLRAILQFVSDNAATLRTQYGNVTPATIGTIQRQLLVLENQGAESFFGEPALTIADFMKTDRDGRGYVNILAADKLIANPRLYAMFLLWLLSELFETLPEIGDPDKPKLVFFFDEAHLLFNDAPKALLEKIEQVVRLIRSKGVGVFFVSQNPLDVPETVLSQLGNRVQHALRAFTPRDQRAVKAAAETFRPNKDLDTAQVITELGKGEALVSFLEGNGIPSVVERTMIRPPVGAARHDRRRRAQDGDRQQPVQGQIRHGGGCGIRLRDFDKTRRGDRRGNRPGRARRRRRLDRRAWRHARRHLRHHPQERRTPDHRTTDRPLGHPHGGKPHRRQARRRHRQVDRRLHGRLDRTRDRARRARRHAAAAVIAICNS